ncbi:hypothetical protein LguiB_001550 [Lonicera macranthoides]
MRPHFQPRLHVNSLYNFRVLAETQFQFLDAQKWVRSRAVDQKLKEAEIKLWSPQHGSEESRLPHGVNSMNSKESATSAWRDFLYISSSAFFLITHHQWRTLRERVRGDFEGVCGAFIYTPSSHKPTPNETSSSSSSSSSPPSSTISRVFGRNLGVFAYVRFRLDSSAILRGIDPPKLELEKKVNDGNILLEGSSDILTMALGMAKHSSLVQGLGFGVKRIAYFNLPRRRSRRYSEESESKYK